MQITSKKTTVRSVEVRFTIEDLRECLCFTDEDGKERRVSHVAVITCVAPNPEEAPNLWEIVVTFDEEVDDESVERDPFAPEPGTRAAHIQGVVLSVIERNGKNGRGMTDAQIVQQVKVFGVGESPAKKARQTLVQRGIVVKVGTRRDPGKTTGKPKAVYKLVGR